MKPSLRWLSAPVLLVLCTACHAHGPSSPDGIRRNLKAYIGRRIQEATAQEGYPASIDVRFGGFTYWWVQPRLERRPRVTGFENEFDKACGEFLEVQSDVVTAYGLRCPYP